jgi:conjugative transfer signal peptidase TraF
VLTVLAVMLCITPMCSRWAPRVLYNASDSMPRGWYRVVPSDALAVGDLVAVRLPTRLARVAAARGYLPIGIPLLKRVAAMHPQEVCVRDGAVYVDGVRVAALRSLDGAGRALNGWPGCRALRRGEVFLLGDHEASFDSRYFGPLNTSCVIARAVDVWIW